MTIQAILLIAIGVVFAAAATLAIIRMVKGPSILDRAVATDVLLTLVLCIMGAEVVMTGRTETMTVMLVIAATGILGTIAVARFVARRDSRGGGDRS